MLCVARKFPVRPQLSDPAATLHYTLDPNMLSTPAVERDCTGNAPHAGGCDPGFGLLQCTPWCTNPGTLVRKLELPTSTAMRLLPAKGPQHAAAPTMARCKGRMHLKTPQTQQAPQPNKSWK